MPVTLSLPAVLVSVLAVIGWTPDPVAIHLGAIPVYWYGIAYAVGIAGTYVVVTREARRRGLDPALVDSGIILVAVAALVGGRLYHVIDQWQLYKDDLLTAILPIRHAAGGGYEFAGFTGLGVYGGIATGTLAAWVLIRRWGQSFWRWADVIAPGLFVMQAVGRWGNFFNQELYGPPTNLPWGLAIDCAHRVSDYPCSAYPFETTAFHPLFLYESLSGVVGAVTLLWIARRWGPRMRPGDLFLLFLVWYAIVRFLLEMLRSGNWTFFGIPTAMVVSAIVIAVALVVLALRHRPGAGAGDRWGDAPARDDEELYDDEDVDDEDVADEDEVVDDEPADDAPTREPADAAAAEGHDRDVDGSAGRG